MQFFWIHQLVILWCSQRISSTSNVYPHIYGGILFYFYPCHRNGLHLRNTTSWWTSTVFNDSEYFYLLPAVHPENDFHTTEMLKR